MSKDNTTSFVKEYWWALLLIASFLVVAAGLYYKRIYLPAYRMDRYGVQEARTSEIKHFNAGTFPKMDVSTLVGWKAKLEGASWFRLYFESTNGRPHTKDWMLCIVRTSGGEKYELLEHFDYGKAMLLTQNPELDELLTSFWSKQGVDNLEKLRQVLKQQGFELTEGEQNGPAPSGD